MPAVREHRALGRAGRARREHDLRHVVGIRRRQRPIVGPAGDDQGRPVVERATRRAGSGSLGAERRRRSPARSLPRCSTTWNTAGRARSVEDVRDLVLAQCRVHRHQHQAGHRRREREHERLGDARRQHRQRVTRREARRERARRPPPPPRAAPRRCAGRASPGRRFPATSAIAIGRRLRRVAQDAGDRSSRGSARRCPAASATRSARVVEVRVERGVEVPDPALLVAARA